MLFCYIQMCKTSLDCSELAWTFKYYWNCYKHLDPCYKCPDICIHVTNIRTDVRTSGPMLQMSGLMSGHPCYRSGPLDPCYKCLDSCPDIQTYVTNLQTHVQASILPIQTSGPPDDLNHGPTG